MTMTTNPTEEVRRVLDAVKAEGRTALTAPEGKLVCEAYGIPVPKEGVAKSAAEAATTPVYGCSLESPCCQAAGKCCQKEQAPLP